MYQLIIRWQLLNRPALIAIGLLLLCLFLPSKSFLAESSRLIIKGSTTILPIASEIGREFQNRHPGVEVSVSGGGSLAGLQALIAGEAQIATSSIFIPEQEIQEAWRRNVYPVPFRIAYDCILPIVNVSNPVTNLSLSPLKKIYLGEIKNWQQLGGPDLDIEVVTRDQQSGTHEVWNRIVMDQAAAVTRLPRRHYNDEMVRAVSASPGPIGYTGLGYLNARIKPL